MKMNDEALERSLEIAYKTVCEFEKSSYENIFVDEDNNVVLQIDKDHFLDLENNSAIEQMSEQYFTPTTYPSYKSLFTKRYKTNFERNVKAIHPELLKSEIGESNLLSIINEDERLKNRYLENVKEVDLDNDGIPDRIDIDDTRNSVQTTSDLSLVANSTDKETEKENKKQRNDDLER